MKTNSQNNIVKDLTFANISRRSFLKGALAAGGALALAGCGEKETATKTTAAADTTAAAAPSAPEIPTKLLPSMNMINAASYILPDYTRCTSCRKCMFACSMKHFGEPDLYKSNIQVYTMNIRGGVVDIPILCMKCKDNPCMNACPDKVQAISRDEVTGAMLLDTEKCTACGKCVDACKEERTGCLRLAKDGSTVVGMCDLCGGNPECVLICPEDALTLSATLRIDGKHWAQNETTLAEIAANIVYSV